MSGGSQGLGLFLAVVFLSGEMAGVGVLALPSAMVHTGPAGLALLLYFTSTSTMSTNPHRDSQ